MAKFKEAFDITLGHEGGYTDDPVDVGGETYCGISRRYNPGWEGWSFIDQKKTTNGPIKNGARFDAINPSVESFYKEKYWDPFLGDEIADQPIANELFDTGVNMGISRAIKFLQVALNCLNRNQSLFDDLVEDGKMGRRTLAALDTIPQERDLIYKLMNVLQGMHYIEYMRQSPTQEKYARGWFKRVTFLK